MSRELTASLGKYEPEKIAAGDKSCYAKITKTWHGTFDKFVEQLLKKVPTVTDKAAAGWVCGAEFKPEYRDSANFKARHFLSLDYDHIAPEDVAPILRVFDGTAFLAHTTWSHTAAHPRLRVWIPTSRPLSYDEFQAVSRKVGERGGIELLARESHTPAQFMFRPAAQKDIPFEHWEDVTSPFLDVDAILGEYDDWKDRKQWPHRAEGDGVHNEGAAESPLDKPGIVGDFCRAYRISDVIERFQLPYTQGTSDDRWTYTLGSRADGAVSYDDDTKLHSHHDTDPARGQNNAYDLVRLHRFGLLDAFDSDKPLAERPSSIAMAQLAMEQPELRDKYGPPEWEDLTKSEPAVAADAPQSVAEGISNPSGAVAESILPSRIKKGQGACTDLENARRIQKKYGDKILSVGEAFFVWTGSHWSKDNATVMRMIADLSNLVADEVPALLARDSSEAGQKAAEKRGMWAAKSSNRSTMSNCEQILRELLDFKGENMNVLRDAITCQFQTVSLRTGEARESRPSDFMTAATPIAYVPGAPRPRFERFLIEIFNGDPELVAFAKRWFGYSITGEIEEHAIVFHVGEGGNGKSLLMKTLGYVLGPGYACKGARSLLSGGSTGATPEMADLLGRRMVTLSETNREEEFNEGVLKELTGGDRIKARNLFEGYFEFEPTHKLQVFTNYEPRIVGQDRGLWRRIFLLPYEVRFGRQADIDAGTATHLQDERLIEALMKEAQGILAWLIEGAVEWYKVGLQPPAAVLKRTEAFKVDQDIMGQFLRERTRRDPSGSVEISSGAESLYGAYKGWIDTMGYRPMARGRFLKELHRAAPYTVRQAGTLKGLRLATEAHPEFH